MLEDKQFQQNEIVGRYNNVPKYFYVVINGNFYIDTCTYDEIVINSFNMY